MTSTEELVRNALADLAPTAPADSTAYAGVGRRITRRRRQRAAARLAAVAAVVVVAVAGAALVGGLRDEPSGFSTQPGEDTTTGPDRGPDGGSPGTGPGRAGGDGTSTGSSTTVLGSASFTLPAGFEAVLQQNQFWLDTEPGGSPAVKHGYTSLCLRRLADPGPLDCTLEMLHGDVPGKEGFEAYDPEGDWSWYRATDVMPCPGGSGPGGTGPGGQDDIARPAGGRTTPVESGFRPVGSRTAAYSRWSVVCERSGFEFSPQAWFLPESQLLIIDVLGQPETEAILASFTFEDEAG
jgi:hypothetical protein